MQGDVAINAEIIECTLDQTEETEHNDGSDVESFSYPTTSKQARIYTQYDYLVFVALLHRSSAQPQAPPFHV
jgi:hypothetical protein